MRETISNIIMIIVLITLLMGAYLAGAGSVEQQQQAATITVNSDLLTAARIYYHLENDEIFYLGDNLCYRRNDSIFLIESAAFLFWYNTSYGKDEGDSLYSAFVPGAVQRGNR